MNLRTRTTNLQKPMPAATQVGSRDRTRGVAVLAVVGLVVASGAVLSPTGAAGPGHGGLAPAGWGGGHQTAELNASDGERSDWFGVSVAISGNGLTAVVGAPFHEEGAGRAYVFSDEGGTWTQTAELNVPHKYDDNMLGNAVAISADGSTVVVGAPYRGPHEEGAAYVFADEGGTWRQTGMLSAADGAGHADFGFAVATSRDGSIVAVGAYSRHNYQGAAYVYADQGGTWAQSGKLIASDGVARDFFGVSVAISGRGSTVVVGATYHENYAGAAYVFSDKGGTWTQSGELTASDGGGGFGNSVSLSGNGASVVIGAVYHGGDMGSAYVFTRQDGEWTQSAELTPSDGADQDYFATSVTMSGNGSTVAVGAPYHGEAGTAYVFSDRSGSWAQSAELTSSDGAFDDYFGESVSASCTGATLLVGAFGHADMGATYVFQR
jgi:hypothetical protein